MNSTDICNMALAYIGQGRIASLEEESEEAAQCRLFYDHLRRRLLAQHYFSFSAREVKLALLDRERQGYDFVYAMPAKCLLLQRVYEKGKAREAKKGEWKLIMVNDSVQGIATDIENAWASYTADVENAAVFSDSFIDALSHGLASAIAVPLSGSGSLQQAHYQLMERAVMTAKFESERQNGHKPLFPTAYTEGRR